jgi:hypothetical protein
MTILLLTIPVDALVAIMADVLPDVIDIVLVSSTLLVSLGVAVVVVVGRTAQFGCATINLFPL